MYTPRMPMIRSRNMDLMLFDAFAELRTQPLNREQRAAFDEIAVASSILADLPNEARRAALAALVELADQHKRDRDAIFYVD